jgi:hypothetical protein
MHLSKTRLDNMVAKDRWRYLITGCNLTKFAKFKKFHSDNPHVFEFLEQEADAQYSNGWRKSSVWLILNIKRWGPGSTHDTESKYKISNDYFAFYARLLIAKNTRYANWIELKSMKGQTTNYSSDSFSGKNL